MIDPIDSARGPIPWSDDVGESARYGQMFGRESQSQVSPSFGLFQQAQTSLPTGPQIVSAAEHAISSAASAGHMSSGSGGVWIQAGAFEKSHDMQPHVPVPAPVPSSLHVHDRVPESASPHTRFSQT
jgi:hypothetical protein